ncbi:uncharacterized protein LOC106177039 [Lingula anatina]|uniref:Uncharacterized protein LOC106177039 n=1 Tax=Lingula anatina TaxID=7574 RepID=A0A1S3JYM6_LINAN|nr:uncharacterized protein LOC106177039 [Lingula anatina]|eukprot:XP_013415131.1 uncharacterized protein LOC106177039 [Lingula anatina]
MDVGGIAAGADFDVLKYPKGFIKIIQFVLAIFAFATTTSVNTFSEWTVVCNGTATARVDKLKIAYPFVLDNQEFTTCGVKGMVYGNFSAPSQFYVFIGVMAFLYSLAIVITYVFFSAKFKENDVGPKVDFIVHIVFGLMWLIASAAWAAGLTGLKFYSDPNEFMKTHLCTAPSTCTRIREGDFASLNVSIIFGFLNLFVWLCNLWFLFKDTPWFHRDTPVPPPQGQPASTPVTPPPQEVPGSMYEEADKTQYYPFIWDTCWLNGYVLAIFAFATTTSVNTFSEWKVVCNGTATARVDKLKIAYPFVLDNQEFTTCGVKGMVYGNFSAPSQFYVFIGVMAFLYSLAIVITYVFFSAKFKENDVGPKVDFIVHIVFGLMWLIASAAWAAGLTGLKFYSDPTEFMGTHLCTAPLTKCTTIREGDFASLNVSIIFGFLNLFVWLCNLWFLFKDTPWFHRDAPVPPPQGQPASTPVTPPPQEVPGAMYEEADKTQY